jgi:PIN domain nuclease of toxin-antitoxin system
MVGLWELADKACKGKLPEFELIMRQQPGGLSGSLQQSGMQLMPIEVSHIEAAYRLPLLHRDPFDRMLIAQALVEDVTVITRDRIFASYDGLRVLPA